VEEEDLESYWGELKQATKTITLASGKASNVREGLELAALKTSADLAQKFKAVAGQVLTVELLTELVSTGIETFLKHWHNDLRSRDAASLVEIVLEGQTMPVEELKAFVRALPMGLIERVVKDGGLGDAASGIHALLAVEWHHRNHRGRDYELQRDHLTGKLVVTAYPARLHGEPLVFQLDERISLRDDRPSGVNEP
jgi:hypothetical protein